VEHAVRDALRERFALEPLGHEKGKTVLENPVLDVLDDALMTKARERRRLELETAAMIRGVDLKNLQRDRAPIVVVGRAKDIAHAAACSECGEGEGAPNDVPDRQSSRARVDHIDSKQRGSRAPRSYVTPIQFAARRCTSQSRKTTAIARFLPSLRGR